MSALQAACLWLALITLDERIRELLASSGRYLVTCGSLIKIYTWIEEFPKPEAFRKRFIIQVIVVSLIFILQKCIRKNADASGERMNSNIIIVVIEQHSDESSFKWELRSNAVNEPHYSLDDLTHLDDRIEANIDGLRVAEYDGWEICIGSLSIAETGNIFTTALLGFENKSEDRIQTVFDASIDNPELCRGIISALGWLPFPQAGPFLQSYAMSDSSALRRIGIAGYTVHRQDPGKIIHDALISNDTMLKARTLKAVGELGKLDLAAAVQDSLNDQNETCRFYAAWSSALLGSMAGVPVLHAIAENDGPYAEKACMTALRRMPIGEGLEWQRMIARNPKSLRTALIGAGAIGDPVLIPWLIEYMAIPELARVAGESFSMITGLDLAYEDLEGEWPEGFEAGPTENPEDEDVDMDPDEDLPWPEPALIQEWWHKNRSNFKTGVRHLCGSPVTEEQCQHVLRYGYQRQRAAAAMDLAMMHPGQPLFNVKAPGFRQQKLLGLV